MSNQVQVDEAEIDAGFAALEGDAELAEANAAAAANERVSDEDSWLPAGEAIIDIVDAKVCPAWKLTAKEKADLAGGIAAVLDQYFPGAISGFESWHPINRLLFAAAGVAVKRVDWKRGGLMPLHERSDDDDDHETGRPVDSGDRQEPLGENGLSFTAGPE